MTYLIIQAEKQTVYFAPTCNEDLVTEASARRSTQKIFAPVRAVSKLYDGKNKPTQEKIKETAQISTEGLETITDENLPEDPRAALGILLDVKQRAITISPNTSRYLPQKDGMTLLNLIRNGYNIISENPLLGKE
ncbi:MAG TPA: hypothetical protein VJB66_02800 [Candidatus Nanoarchaeia archaeon]|nr:hypothetical protein [Candidatus Nanoarchaeia archaeon]